MKENLNIEFKGNELVIREGKAPEIEPIKQVVIAGTIESVATFLEKRKEVTEQLKAHIIVDKDNMEISLKINENFATGSEISGKIEHSKKFIDFGINQSKTWSTFELADFIKMNRSAFENVSEASNLVLLLRNFKAKVDKDIEKADDKRGNRSLLIREVVDSNIPNSFNLMIPIFKGKSKERVEVEVNIGTDFNCSLISAQAKEIADQTADGYISEQVEKIAEICPEIAIIYV